MICREEIILRKKMTVQMQQNFTDNKYIRNEAAFNITIAKYLHSQVCSIIPYEF